MNSAKRVLLSLFIIMFLSLVSSLRPASAQAQVWIQIESQPNIRRTKQQVQRYAAEFGDIEAYLTRTGWYAIVIGPMGEDLATSTLVRLKSSGKIPADSFITDGGTHLSRLWPIGGEQQRQVATITSSPEPVRVSNIASHITENVVGSTPPSQIQEIPPAQMTLGAAKSMEKAWNKAQKKLVQTYLIWSGDYSGKIDGAIGAQTRKAITAYQQTAGFGPSGYLTQTQVNRLAQSYADTQRRLGLGLVQNLDAGIEIQLPGNLVEFDGFAPPFVTYRAKTERAVTLRLISQVGDQARLSALYDSMETLDFIPADGFRVKKRDWFVLSGQDETTVSYTYVKLSKGMIKGFSLIWTPEYNREMKPVASAMYSSFRAIDGYVLDEDLGGADLTSREIDLSDGLDILRANRLASGFVLNAEGYILTNSAIVKGCSRVSLANSVDLELVARNPKMQLALLRPAAGFAPKSYVLFSDEAPEVGSDVTVSGFSYPDVMERAALSFGLISADTGLGNAAGQFRMDVELEGGDTGGPVLDDRGAVVGMQRQMLAEDSPLPSYVNVATRAADIMALLDRHAVTYGRTTAFEPVDAEDLTFMADGFTVKIACWQ